MAAATPYVDLLPPLTSDEFSALKASVKESGVLVPVDVDTDGNVLDGHHRLRCDPQAKRIVRRELKTDAEKRAFVFRSNLARRNLSPSQRMATLKQMRGVALDLKLEGHTQAQIATMLGAPRETVRDWCGAAEKSGTSNGGSANACTPENRSTKTPPDCRVKVNPSHKPVIAKRVAAGETQAQVAADYGVTQQAVATVCRQVAKVAAVREEREKNVAKLGDDIVGIHHGDFRELGNSITDDSVDMIFTDPPYLENDLAVYGDLAKFALRVLRPGGWCIAYSGQYCLPQVMSSMSEHLTYAWTFAIYHSGGYVRFRKFKLYNGWKPLVAFFKPPLKVWWDWFNDYTRDGGREKEAHEWQQSQSEAEHFIGHMTVKKALIVDPFCGSGTTLAAAKELGRSWVGFEINTEHVAGARVRLSK